MKMPEPDKDTALIELAAEVVAAYVSRNSVPRSELAGLIESVHAALATMSGKVESQPAAEAPKPAVPIKKSITDDFIICLEDGKRFKSLKRHLSSAYGMTPQDYRAKWGLDKDYPMVAPAYASQRSALARSLGLGRTAKGKSPEPAAASSPEAAAPAKGTRRRLKAAA